MMPVILHHQGSSFTFNVPTGTDELNARQAVRLYRLLHSQVSVDEYLAQLALILFDVRPLDVRGRRWLGSLDGGQFEELQPMLDPFTPSETNEIKQEEQVVPGFWSKGWYYAGPASRLANISLIEFAFADHHFLKWHEGKKDEDLFALLACLYRPWRYGNLGRIGDCREVFNRYTYEERGKVFAKRAMLGHAYYALEFFQSGRAIITERWKDLFSGEEQEKAQSTGNGWVNLMYSIAGDKFGTLQQAGQARLTDVLLYCKQMKEENERIREESNKV